MQSNICSCVVHAKPGEGQDLAERLGALQGIEVHGGAEVDKLVVTVEDHSDSLAADRLGELNQFPGVVSTVLIYHYAGDDLDETIGA